MSDHVIHVVRRFSLAGGMEAYVWHLVHQLVDRGVSVTVLCVHSDPCFDKKIHIVKIAVTESKRRYLAMLKFSLSVDEWWSENKEKYRGALVHSHERTNIHNITTFHGPPMASIREAKPFLSLVSPRIKSWLALERRELCVDRVKVVLPVSELVRNAIEGYYPSVKSKILMGAYPGVSEDKVDCPEGRTVKNNHIKVLFVGKEFRRKGLSFAIEVIGALRSAGIDATLDIYGVRADQVPRKLNLKGFTRFHGYSDVIPWEDYDVLIHPASNEPFGMVVAEAIQKGLAVVASTQVGARDLFSDYSQAQFLDLADSPDVWAKTVIELVRTSHYSDEPLWTWKQLALFHERSVYV